MCAQRVIKKGGVFILEADPVKNAAKTARVESATDRDRLKPGIASTEILLVLEHILARLDEVDSRQ